MRRGRGAWAVAENSPGSQGEAGWCGKGERGQGVVAMEGISSLGY